MATKTKKVQVVGISADDLGVVSYDITQDLTDEQKVQARENIDVPKAATDDEMFNTLIETDILMAVTDKDGAILTDENNNIIMW